MVPAAVPVQTLGDLEQGLRGAENAGDAEAFARSVCGALAEYGVASSTHLRRLANGKIEHPQQALADCIHFLTIFHGEAPSLFDIARSAAGGTAGDWMALASAQFDADRRWLARLDAATGSAIDRQGQSISEQRVRDQREAMLTLARSSRDGCALGAAIALAHDWDAVRGHIRSAVANIEGRDEDGSKDSTEDLWPLATLTPALVDVGADHRQRRAVSFGALQLASLHFQLFALLEARHAARLSD